MGYSRGTVDERARAELQFALLDALANRESYGMALERVRRNLDELYAHGLDPATVEISGISLDFEALSSATQALRENARTPVTRLPASRVLEEAASGPLRAAFLARALNALATIASEVPESALSEAVSASSDHEALIRALERLVVHGRSPEEMERDALMDEAQLRGVRSRDRLLTAEGGALSVKDVAQRLHITRQAVDARRKKGKLLALNTGRWGYAYPGWQFDDEGVLPGLEQILRALADLDPWTQLAFMLNPNSRLGGTSPLAEIRRGHIAKVLSAAEAYGEQGGA